MPRAAQPTMRSNLPWAAAWTPAAPQRVASQRSNGVGVATTREDTYALHELSPGQLIIRHRAIFLALHRI